MPAASPRFSSSGQVEQSTAFGMPGITARALPKKLCVKELDIWKLLAPQLSVTIFAVVFYNNQCYARYMSLYNSCVDIDVNAKNLVSELLVDFGHDPDLKGNIRQACKYCLAGIFFFYLSMEDKETTWRIIRDKGLLTESEIRRVSDFPGTVSGAQLDDVSGDLFPLNGKQGQYTPPELAAMSSRIYGIIDRIGVSALTDLGPHDVILSYSVVTFVLLALRQLSGELADPFGEAAWKGEWEKAWRQASLLARSASRIPSSPKNKGKGVRNSMAGFLLLHDEAGGKDWKGAAKLIRWMDGDEPKALTIGAAMEDEKLDVVVPAAGPEVPPKDQEPPKASEKVLPKAPEAAKEDSKCVATLERIEKQMAQLVSCMTDLAASMKDRREAGKIREDREAEIEIQERRNSTNDFRCASPRRGTWL
eukprot:Skav232132  [mRNA]  locus=scaffold1744:129601:141452:- [translate_table: standard]